MWRHRHKSLFCLSLLVPIQALMGQSSLADGATAIVGAYYKAKGLSEESVAHRKIAAHTPVGAMEMTGEAVWKSRTPKPDSNTEISEAQRVLNRFTEQKRQTELSYGVYNTASSLTKIRGNYRRGPCWRRAQRGLGEHHGPAGCLHGRATEGRESEDVCPGTKSNGR
jgi:hypothetical protein